MNQPKICVLSSSGGHFAELSQLESFYKRFEYFYVVERSPTLKILNKSDKVYLLYLINRRMRLLIPKLLLNAVISLIILLKERPNYIITTGALATIPMGLLGRLTGAKLIFIESFCRVKTQGRTGKLFYRFANLFIVQHRQQLAFYPKAQFGGSIF